MRKQLFLSLLGTVALGQMFSQDIHFSQYFVAPQLINPAGFGVLNTYEAGVQYKGQWNSFTNGYTSFAAFANKSFKKEKDVNSSKAYLSAGFNVIYDKAGSSPLTHFKAELPLNVTKQTSNSGFLTGGIYLGYGQLALKSTNLTWGNQYDGTQYNSTLSSNESTIGQTKSYLDCGAGLSHVALKKGVDVTLPINVIGFSVNHLNRPDFSLYGMPGAKLGMRINFYEYYHIYLKNSSTSIIPSVMVQYQSKAYEVVVGAAVRKGFKDAAADAKTTKYASLGLFYRVNDMFALNATLQLSNYSLGINYDFNVSKLTASSKNFGGLELALKINRPFQYSYKNSSKLIDKKI